MAAVNRTTRKGSVFFTYEVLEVGCKFVLVHIAIVDGAPGEVVSSEEFDTIDEAHRVGKEKTQAILEFLKYTKVKH